MGDAASDPYAAARSSLRDTAKWMATVLSGLGAAVAAGVSVAGFASLTGPSLHLAITAATTAMVLILMGIGLLLRLLGVEAYYLSTLGGDKDLIKRIDKGGSDLLPPGVKSFTALKNRRDESYEALAALSNEPQDDPKRKIAESNYASWRAEVGRILSFASFLRLRRLFNRTMVGLLILFVGASASLAFLGYQLAKASPKEAVAQTATLEPGGGWDTLAAELRKLCGTEPFAVETMGEVPFAGWWTVTLKAPSACAGAMLTVPEAMVSIAAEPE